MIVVFNSFVICLSLTDVDPVIGVVGSSTYLSCNMTPPSINDKVYLVLWFKDDNPLPIYSYDAREFTKKRWSEDKMFGARTTFRDTVSPSQLRIDRLERTDAGKYTCRVDFRNSPTVYSEVMMQIVEKSSKPVVITDDGVEVQGQVGPYLLGQSVILVCMAEGDPPPSVVWTRDGERWDEDMDPSQSTTGQRRNTLVISPLERQHAGNKFRCLAENNHISQPPFTDIVIEMNLPVLDIRLVSLPSPLQADKRYEVLCQAVGGYPAPQLSWSMTSSHGITRNISSHSSPTQLSARGNLSTSMIELTLGMSEHASVLTCTASMPSTDFPPVNISRQLIVNHPAIVSVDIVGDVTRLTEGSVLHMKCQANARPAVQEYLWYKDGQVISRGSEFVINNVTRNDNGDYFCEAINSEGIGQSGKIKITVVYKPFCHSPTVTKHPQNFSPGVSLTCGVESFPAARSYRWQYNSSQGSFEIPNAKSMMSFMNYAVSEKGGEGEVLCWATNDIGEQSSPCVFHVVPLGAPQPPHDCHVSMNDTRVHVSCEPGYSGGEEQHFVLSLLDMVDGVQTPISSNWSADPHHLTLYLTDLTLDNPRLLSVHSANSHGKSEPVYLTTDLSDISVGEMSDIVDNGDRQSVLYIIVSVLSSIMILSLLLSLSHACRRRRLERLASKIEADKPNIQLLAQSTPLLSNQNNESRADPKEDDHYSPAKDLLPRKVSFCDQCHHNSRLSVQNQCSAPLGNGVQKTVIRSYSIDKLRPRCFTCNPTGDIPYPFPNQGDSSSDYYDNV